MNEVARLMAEDPLKLTRENLRAIVEEYRGSRHLFQTVGKTTPAKQSAAEAAGVKLNLDELGL